MVPDRAAVLLVEQQARRQLAGVDRLPVALRACAASQRQKRPCRLRQLIVASRQCVPSQRVPGQDADSRVNRETHTHQFGNIVDKNERRTGRRPGVR